MTLEFYSSDFQRRFKKGHYIFRTVFECRAQWPARSKACVCGRSLAGIVGSNPVGGMDVCLL